MTRSFIKFLILPLFGLFLISGCSEDTNPVGNGNDSDHFEAIGLYLIQSGDTIVAYLGGTVSGEIEVAAGALTPLIYVKFVTDDGAVGTPQGDHHNLQLEIADTSIAQVVRHSGEEWEYHIRGKIQGTTTIKISIFHDDHPDFVSKPIPIQVVSGSGTVHDEPEGLILIHETTGDTLVMYDMVSNTVEGSLSVGTGQHSGHISVQFFDHDLIYFAPDPAEHSLQFEIADTAVAVVEQHDPVLEPWTFEVEGKQTGNTTMIIRLLHLSHAEFTSGNIPIEVHL